MGGTVEYYFIPVFRGGVFYFSRRFFV